MIKNKKAFLEISFGWMFALIVGAVILFLAIYFSLQFIKTETTTQDVIKSKEVGIILNPLEIGFETGKTTFLELPTETRFYNNCSEEGNFGKQTIEVSQKTFGKWAKTNLSVAFPNKYIFSSNVSEGRNFYVFSKPFEFPFKVADLIYLIPSNEYYCFIGTPINITREIRDLNLKNIVNVTSQVNCPPGSKKVCFGGGTGCHIRVIQNPNGDKIVEKAGKSVASSKDDALMYAAIFSDLDVYECQLKRLMSRTKELAKLYDEKATFISGKGCTSNLNLLSLEQEADNFVSSRTSLASAYSISQGIKQANENLGCRLW